MSLEEQYEAARRRNAKVPDSFSLAPRPTSCRHDWIDRGTPEDLWRECFLCGKQEDV